MFNYNIATMKATIVKDNNFKTIGFEVTLNGKSLYSWGIAPQPTNFTKEVNTNDWAKEIFTLVSLEAKLSEQRNFISKAFDYLIADKKGGIKFRDNGKEIEQTEKAIESIISKII